MAMVVCVGYAVMALPTFCAAEITSVTLQWIDPSITATGAYRWQDVAGQVYGNAYRSSYGYGQSNVVAQVTFERVASTLCATFTATNLKPNFAYQAKLSGDPGTTGTNELIGLTGRWWQEEWNGAAWVNGWNLNNKGNGYYPNPNDTTYFSRRDTPDPTSPTGKKYRYTGYRVFDYFITDQNGNTSFSFEVLNCYHVLWKTNQRAWAANDGPIKTVTFDPSTTQPAYETDYPEKTESVFGEWERLPMGGLPLLPGDYSCQIMLTEESFHGWDATNPYPGGWAAAMGAPIQFMIGSPPANARRWALY
jgi:hypothetical protein